MSFFNLFPLIFSNLNNANHETEKAAIINGKNGDNDDVDNNYNDNNIARASKTLVD